MCAKVRFQPLDPDIAQRFEEAAEDHDDFLTSLTGRALLLLGLRPITFTHTLSQWIERRGSRLVFRVTPYSEIPGMDGECIQGKGESGQGNPQGEDLHERGEPCTQCRDTKGDDSFLGKSSNTPRSWVLSTSPELKRLGEDFEWWFEQNQRIPFGGDGVRRRVRAIAEEADLDEELGTKELKQQGTVPDINPYDLRHTYGTRLARMEWEPYEIMEQMGHGSTEMPMKYISFTGKRKEQLMNEKWDPDQY